MNLFDMLGTVAFLDLAAELRAGLELFWDHADVILKDSGARLAAPSENYFQLKHNFFSALFLLSYQRAGIDPARRPQYVAVNQCLRGMVTGCDNILDNEYKMTLDTDIPGTRFRSVIDIMVSDRVLFDLLLDLHHSDTIPLAQVRRAHAASLQALTRSGMQEATEEAGVHDVLKPERILDEIHHLKTGLLFQSVWAIPMVLEPEIAATAKPLSVALYQIGMGCQVLDDMVDLGLDTATHRHNYMASLILHRALDQHAAKADLDRGMDAAELLSKHARAVREASNTARTFLGSGLQTLLGPQGASLVTPAISFLIHRIGAQELMTVEPGA